MDDFVWIDDQCLVLLPRQKKNLSQTKSKVFWKVSQNDISWVRMNFQVVGKIVLSYKRKNHDILATYKFFCTGRRARHKWSWYDKSMSFSKLLFWQFKIEFAFLLLYWNFLFKYLTCVSYWTGINPSQLLSERGCSSKIDFFYLNAFFWYA